MPSLLNLKIASLSNRGKKKSHWTLANQNYVAHLVFFCARICQLMPHSKSAINDRKPSAHPILACLMLLLPTVGACGGGKKSVLVWENSLLQYSPNTELLFLLCVYACTHMCRHAQEHLKEWEKSSSEPALPGWRLAWRL